MLSILVVVSCVHRRAYNCTCTRRVRTTTYPGHTYTEQPRHKRMYTHAKLQRYSSTRANANPRVHYVRHSGCSCQILYGYKYSVRAQARGPTNDRCIAQAVHAKYCTGTSTACKPKHAGLRTIGASPRLSMPNTVRILVQRVRPSTRAYAQSVHRPGCPCQILYGTSTACEPKHAGLRTIDASPRLSMPNTVRVEVQRVSPSTQAYARSVHRPGCPYHKLYVYKYSVQAQARGLSTIGASPRLSMPNVAQAQYAQSVHRPGCPC